MRVTAESPYEAVARGLKAFQDTDWAGDIGLGQTMITVLVRQPEVEHKVRMRDFDAWLESTAPSPAESRFRSRALVICRVPGNPAQPLEYLWS
jgi:hypothetical protein